MRVLIVVTAALLAAGCEAKVTGGSAGGASGASGGGTTSSASSGSSSSATSASSTSSGASSGGTTSTGSASSSSSTGSSGSSSGGSAFGVLQQHNDGRRTGLYVDPAFTPANVASVHPDTAFAPSYSGPTYAQPLYLGGATRDLVYVATEQNDVHAFDADTGQEVWSQNLGAPWPLSDLPCGNIDPLGITGTPVIDAATRTLYVDAMVHNVGHQVFALDADTGAVRSGWPVSLEGAATSNGATFTSSVQNQRGALALSGTTLYVPFGGHYGDCGDYRGWVISIDTVSRAVSGWATRARGGGIWAPGGVVLDGARPFVSTGNTFGTSTWQDGEAVIELAQGSFDPASGNYWAPTNWHDLDVGDIDMSGTAPLLFDLGASHAALALGKDGNAYLLDRDALGGISAALDTASISSDEIINYSAYVADAQGVLVFFVSRPSSCPVGSGDLGAVRVSVGATPSVTPLWCGDEGENLPGGGSPIITSPDGQGGFVVWGVGAGDGSGSGDGKLRAWDAETGQLLFDGTGSLTAPVRRFEAPIVARGRIFIAGESRLERYSLP